MNNISVIYEYDIIMNRLAKDIKNSDFKVHYFLKLLNLKSGFFYKKLREKRFTSEEVKLISKHIYPEEFQEFQDEQLNKFLEISRQQLKEGNNEDFEKILLKSKQKYGLL